MNERDFCYWLRGYFELVEAQWEHRTDDLTFDINTMAMNKDQVNLIKKHLDLVMENKAGFRVVPADHIENVPTCLTC